MVEPLNPASARKLITTAFVRGLWVLSVPHAVTEMFNDGFMQPDVDRCIEGGVVRDGQFENGSWRYPVINSRMICIITFDRFDPPSFTVVTVYKNKRGTIV